MNKPANNDHPIHDIIRERWSPRAFSSRPIDRETILSLLEAARWAPSSRNDQPWHFIVATKDDPDAYDELLNLLKTSNQRWAGNAPLLLLTVARVDMGEYVNRNALHDVGQAVAYLTFQAQAHGLSIRQMGGIMLDEMTTAYGIPEGYEVLNAMAVGYVAEPETLPEDLQAKEHKPRERKPLSEFVFREWGQASPLLQDEPETAGD